MTRIAFAWLFVLVFSLNLHADEPKPAAFEGQGIVVPVRRLTLTSAAPGRVVEVLVEEGQRVKQGQVLFRLERQAEEVQLKRADVQLGMAKLRFEQLRGGAREEGLNQAKAEVAAAEAAYKFAEVTLERIRKLRATGTASAEELDQAEAAFRSAKAQFEKHRAAFKAAERGAADDLAAARLAIDAAQVEVEGARLAFQAREVHAPFDGTMLRVSAEAGGFTNPAAIGLANAASLGELADLSAPVVEATLSQEHHGRVARGMACEVQVSVLRGKTFKGTVERISPAVDPLRSTFTVRVRMTTTESIPPGASALVRFPPRQ